MDQEYRYAVTVTKESGETVLTTQVYGEVSAKWVGGGAKAVLHVRGDDQEMTIEMSNQGAWALIESLPR